MEILLLIFLPLVGAGIVALAGKSQSAKIIALIFSLVSLAVTGYLLSAFTPQKGVHFLVDLPWIPEIGTRFKAGIDGINIIPVLLTNGLMPLIILSSFKHPYNKPGAFYALILFMQSGLLLVFTAFDAFLFYIGWEAALIPIYFICAIWGGENRIRVNLKFFIYTIFGSLIMLIAIIYLQTQTPNHTYDLESIYQLSLDSSTQGWIF